MDTDDNRSGMIQRELDAEEISERAAKLAAEEVEREALLEKKRSHNREWNEQLKQLGTSIGVLAAEVDTGKAWVPAQSDLFEVAANDEEEEAPVPARRRRGRRSAASVGDAA